VPAVDEAAVAAAVGGDRDALETVLRAVQDDIYRLAHRMLWHPQDAEDATQEILVKVATRLSTFRGDARVTTWVHRIAVNHLLTARKRRTERQALSFEAFGEDLAQGRDRPFDAPGVDEELLAEEVKVGCTQGMLLCLDRPHRIAYILGDILELPGDEAASILDISAAAYRKRLQRAREHIQQFMRGHCGLIDPTNPCRCSRRVGTAIATGRVDPDRLLFAGRVARHVESIERMRDAAAVFRSHPELRAPERVLAAVTATLRDQRMPTSG
jgi:RNA polymerase sigma factor (sigma-70 family)